MAPNDRVQPQNTTFKKKHFSTLRRRRVSRQNFQVSNFLQWILPEKNRSNRFLRTGVTIEVEPVGVLNTVLKFERKFEKIEKKLKKKFKTCSIGLFLATHNTLQRDDTIKIPVPIYEFELRVPL